MTVTEIELIRPFPTPMDIKLIVSDVDGTLLNSAHELPTTSPTYKVLRRIRETYPSLPIIISTGKQYRSTAELREALDLCPFPCCHCNGNVIYSPSGSIISESGLEIPVVLEALEQMRKIGASAFVYDYSTVYQLYKGPGDVGQWAAMLRGYGEIVIEIPEDEVEAFVQKIENEEVKAIKLGLCQDAATIEVPKAHLQAHFPATAFAMTQALPNCIELIPAAHNKGTALMTLVKHLNSQGANISLENVIAFGDGENDVSMFRVAGMSVAMGNAMKSARKEAIWTTDSNDWGGVGTFLEKVFWPKEN
ncbi:HAD-like domain-containing protein [Sphaerosporella brunnea]|uniref:HAD-like domain-containing protein n=1 Tax=Sphaerosporella brunnea TaxID=1250544 RepID=A0A5J5F2Q4_9PEZI|nr:HAD-like domain-containing protein [Sphaerosporella brunnea]